MMIGDFYQAVMQKSGGRDVLAGSGISTKHFRLLAIKLRIGSPIYLCRQCMYCIYLT